MHFGHDDGVEFSGYVDKSTSALQLPRSQHFLQNLVVSGINILLPVTVLAFRMKIAVLLFTSSAYKILLSSATDIA